MINKVILTGRLTSDIQLRRTNDGTSYTFFTIAVNRRQQDQTDFISCISWRQTAELMDKYLNKGSLIGVEGRIEVFTQRKDGNYDTRTNVNVTQVTFLESKTQSDNRSYDQKTNNSNQGLPQLESEKPMSFDSEKTFDQSETTSFGSAEKVNANDINLEEIKF